MSYTEELRTAAAPIWDQCLRHPFVQGIGDGTLPAERFRFYVRQDYVFLIEYSRFLALAVAKAPEPETMGKLASLLHATLNTEMALHRSYCAQFGISEAELEATQPAPTTYAYTRHLLAVAYSSPFPDLLAALLPCQWGYCEIGQALARRGEPVHAPLYAQWVRTYADPEFAALAQWMRQLLDRAAAGASDDDRRRWRELFLLSSRYEYLFWEMAYRGEKWPT